MRDKMIIKSLWEIDHELPSYRGTLYIKREWVVDSKPNLTERKLINVSEIPLYIPQLTMREVSDRGYGI